MIAPVDGIDFVKFKPIVKKLPNNLYCISPSVYSPASKLKEPLFEILTESITGGTRKQFNEEVQTDNLPQND